LFFGAVILFYLLILKPVCVDGSAALFQLKFMLVLQVTRAWWEFVGGRSLAAIMSPFL